MFIAQIVFDRFTDIDVFLAWDLLNRVRRPDWTVRLLGTSAAHTSAAGLAIPMHGQVEEAAGADAVLFASGLTTRELRFDRAYLARFRLDPERQLIGSMCSGALLLAALGLLGGKRATTHPNAEAELRQTGVEVVREPFICEGNVATAAACLAGVDLAGWVIERLLGKEARGAACAELERVRPAPAVAARDLDGAAKHRGSCLCGALRYELTEELGDFGYCHCKSCRKASGTAHASNAPIDRSHFRLVSSAQSLREFESSPGKYRAFCSACGSPLYAYLSSSPGVLRIRLGSLDTPFTQRGKAHTFVAEQAEWHPITDAAPQFPAWAPKHVLVQRGSRQGEP